MGSVSSVLKTILKCAFQPESKMKFLCGRFPFQRSNNFHLAFYDPASLAAWPEEIEVKRSVRDGGNLSQASQVSAFF